MKTTMNTMAALAVSSFFVGVGQALAKIDYTTQVFPIIQESCIKCHNDPAKHPEGKKPKAGLRFDTPEQLMKGNDDGPVVVKGDPSKSSFYTRTILPADDDDIMPPKGDPLSKEQQKLIHDWIKAGASTDGWDPAKVPQTASADKAEKKVALVDQLAKGLSPLGKDRTKGVADIGGLVMPLANNNNLLQVNLSLTDKDVGDVEVGRLASLASHLTWLNLAGTKVTDAGIKNLSSHKNLTRLHLEKTAISDAGLVALTSLDNLEYLNLYGTKVTNNGLKELAKLKNLKKVYLWQTGVDKAGVEQLKKQKPELYVNIGWEKPPEPKKDETKTEEPKKTSAKPAAKPAAKVTFASLAPLFDAGSCCDKAHKGKKECGHGCCKAALAKGSVCLKCNPGAKGKKKS